MEQESEEKHLRELEEKSTTYLPTYIPTYLLRNSCSFGLLNVYMVLVPYCKFGFFPPRFLEWESFSDCAFS